MYTLEDKKSILEIIENIEAELYILRRFTECIIEEAEENDMSGGQIQNDVITEPQTIEDTESKDEQVNIKVCTECGSSTNKFRPKGKKCIKCYSKKNNDKLKDTEYHKKYYLEHEGTKHKRRQKKEISEI